MMNHNPRPMSMRKTVQLMVILTILAWATQTLFAQWGYGGLILPEPSPFGGAAPATTRRPTIELRARVKFDGDVNVTLRDLCRWSEHDDAMMQPLADTPIAQLGSAATVRQVSVADIKARLHDAGANLSTLHFTGSARCAVIVGNAKESDFASETGRGTPAADPFQSAAPEAIVAEAPAATQPAEEVVFHEQQLVLTRPLSRGQKIIASDLIERRVQIEQPTTRPSVAKADVIGTVAARDLRTGEVFNAEDSRAMPIITAGQFMTVAMRIGEMEIETVARSMDGGARGETVRARNEANGDVYRVVITAPNQGRVAVGEAADDDKNVATIQADH